MSDWALSLLVAMMWGGIYVYALVRRTITEWITT